MKSTILVLVVLASLVAASSAGAGDVYRKPGAGDADFFRDEYVCQVYTDRRYNGRCNPWGTNVCDKFFRECMNSKGWALVDEDAERDQNARAAVTSDPQVVANCALIVRVKDDDWSDLVEKMHKKGGNKGLLVGRDGNKWVVDVYRCM